MMNKLKFKLYDKKKNIIADYINCSISIANGEVQSFNNKMEIEGTVNNSHLVPIQYTNKNDMQGKEIYQGFIVQREGGTIGEENIIGVVKLEDCCWWIVNEKEQRSVQLFSETAMDKIIGNIYQNPELIV